MTVKGADTHGAVLRQNPTLLGTLRLVFSGEEDAHEDSQAALCRLLGDCLDDPRVGGQTAAALLSFRAKYSGDLHSVPMLHELLLTAERVRGR